MQVKEIMHTDVKTIEPNATIQQAAEVLGQNRIGGLVVAKNNRLTGIVTERDIITKVVATARDPQKTRVKDIMTAEVYYITPGTDIEDAGDLMVDKKIKRLPVVEKGMLVGIVTATDLCAAQPQMIEKMSEYLFSPKRQTVAG